MDDLFQQPHAPSLHVFVAALALAGVLAGFNGVADRCCRSGRWRTLAACALVGAAASVALLLVMGFNALQSIVIPLAGAPLVLGVFAAKVRLRRALHLPG